MALGRRKAEAALAPLLLLLLVLPMAMFAATPTAPPAASKPSFPSLGAAPRVLDMLLQGMSISSSSKGGPYSGSHADDEAASNSLWKLLSEERPFMCDPDLDPPCACSTSCTSQRRNVVGWTFGLLLAATVVFGVGAWMWHKCCASWNSGSTDDDSVARACVVGTVKLLGYLGLQVYDIVTDFKFIWELAESGSIRALAITGMVLPVTFLIGEQSDHHSR